MELYEIGIIFQGQTLLLKQYRSRKFNFNQDQRGTFLAAINHFAIEDPYGFRKIINLGEYECLFLTRGLPGDPSTIIVIYCLVPKDPNFSMVQLEPVLDQILNWFLLKHLEILKNFKGDLSPFGEFPEVIEEIVYEKLGFSW